MEIKITKQVINIVLHLDEHEASMLKQLITFAFDYDSIKKGSLYTSEKEFGLNLIDKLEEITKWKED